MPRFNVRITRTVSVQESTVVGVEAETEERALEVADEIYSEGEFETSEWEKDGDTWDSHDAEFEIEKET